MAVAFLPSSSTPCFNRWFPAAPTAPGSDLRWRRRLRVSTAAKCVTRAAAIRVCSPCCYRWRTRMAEQPMIWIVDDDRSVRVVLAAALSDAGFDVREFTDAESAIAALEDDQPAVLFTDVRMRNIDGLELLERMADHASNCPTIVMSAYT